MKKISLILLAVLFAALIIGKISWAQEEKMISEEKAAAILKKIDQLSKGQEQMLAQLAEIKEELKIIKMRTALK